MNSSQLVALTAIDEIINGAMERASSNDQDAADIEGDRLGSELISDQYRGQGEALQKFAEYLKRID